MQPRWQGDAYGSRNPVPLLVGNGQYTLYEDDGISEDYLKGKATLTRFSWDDAAKQLTITPLGKSNAEKRVFKVLLLPEGTIQQLTYTGRPLSIHF